MWQKANSPLRHAELVSASIKNNPAFDRCFRVSVARQRRQASPVNWNPVRVCFAISPANPDRVYGFSPFRLPNPARDFCRVSLCLSADRVPTNSTGLRPDFNTIVNSSNQRLVLLINTRLDVSKKKICIADFVSALTALLQLNTTNLEI